MYLKIKELEARGIKVEVSKTHINFIPSAHWTDEALEAYRKFCDALPLTDQESDEASQFIANLTVINTLRQVAH